MLPPDFIYSSRYRPLQVRVYICTLNTLPLLRAVPSCLIHIGSSTQLRGHIQQSLFLFPLTIWELSVRSAYCLLSSSMPLFVFGFDDLNCKTSIFTCQPLVENFLTILSFLHFLIFLSMNISGNTHIKKA